MEHRDVAEGNKKRGAAGREEEEGTDLEIPRRTATSQLQNNLVQFLILDTKS